MSDSPFWLNKSKSSFKSVYLWMIILLSSAYFLFYPSNRKLPGKPADASNAVLQAAFKLNTVSRSRIAINDYYTGLWTSALRIEYDPNTSAIFVLGKDYDWRRVTFQLPEFRVVQLSSQAPSRIPLQMGYRNDITVFSESFSMPPHIKTLIFLTENQGFVENYVPVSAKIVKKTGPEGLNWFEYNLE